MKPEKYVGRYARLKVETMFFRKPGLLQITKVGTPERDGDFQCYGVELDTGREVGPFMRSEAAILRDRSPISAKHQEGRIHQTVVRKFAVQP